MVDQKIQHEKYVAEKVEKLLERAGPFGKFQIGYMVAIQLLAWQYCGNFIFMSFSGLPTPFSCPGTNLTATSDSYSSVCNLVSTCESNYTVSKPFGFATVTYEWPELVTSTCVGNTSTSFVSSERKTITATMIAAGLAIIPSGILSDLLGRKTLLVIGSTSATLLGIVASVADSFLALNIFYVIAVVFVVLCSMPALSLCSEYTLTKYRLMMNFAVTWCLAYVVAAGMAYLTRDWRKYLLAWNFMALPLVGLFIFFEESPRWLLIKGKYEAVARTLTKISRVNGKNEVFTTEEIEDLMSDVKPPKIQKTCLADAGVIFSGIGKLFVHKNLAPITMVIIFYQFSAALLGMAFQFNLDRFFTVPYTSIALMGLIRIWSPFLVVFMDMKMAWFKRRNYFFVSYVAVIVPVTFAAVLSLIEAYAAKAYKSTANLAMTICYLVANGMNFGLLWFVFMQVTLEVYPTVVRNAAFGTVNMATTLGAALGPFLIQTQVFWPPMPYVVIAVLMWASFVVAAPVFPETKGKALPDTFDDLHLIFDDERAETTAGQNVVKGDPAYAVGQEKIHENYPPSEKKTSGVVEPLNVDVGIIVRPDLEKDTEEIVTPGELASDTEGILLQRNQKKYF